MALLLLLVLSGAALVLLARRGELRHTPLVLGLACMGWLTPLIVFVLSKPPINLPLFALRHVLPATLYRPSAKEETQVYKRLLSEGYSLHGETYFTDRMSSSMAQRQH